MPATKYATVFGKRMAFYDAGSGKTLVLIHGAGSGSVGAWSKVFNALAKRYRVIAVDLPNFGRSDMSSGPLPRPEAQVDHLAELLRQLQIRDFYIGGQSMGGLISTLYAIKAAQPGAEIPKPTKLVVTDGALPFALEKYFDGRGNTSDDPKKVFTRLYFEENSSDITIPTLIIWGGKDTIVPLETGQILHSKVKSSKLEIIEEAAHNPQMETPAAWLKRVINFLGP